MERKKEADRLNLLCDIGKLAELLYVTPDVEVFLQKSAEMVAGYFLAPVCSIYTADSYSDELVLTATVGLNADAVGVIRLKPGEGLVGTVSQTGSPLCVGDASTHAAFRYFPEAGEDRLSSFLGVPIHRGLQQIGVLVVQHEDADYFSTVDERALTAVAMQLAVTVANARLMMQLPSTDEGDSDLAARIGAEPIRATVISRGDACALITVGRHRFDALFEAAEVDDPPLTPDHLDAALQATQRQLAGLQERFSHRLPESEALIFTSHFMILKDPAFTGMMRGFITDGHSVHQAVRRTAKHYIALFASNPLPHIAEKADDIRDLTARILRNLDGMGEWDNSGGQDRIFIADHLFPSDILKLVSDQVRGVIVAGGEVTSHAAILARSLRIPVMSVNRRDLMELPRQTLVWMDGDTGNLFVAPNQTVLDRYERKVALKRVSGRSGDSMADATYTRDGERVRLLANINLLSELPLARELKAEGIGLYRTEFPFIIRSSIPSEPEQYRIYKTLMDGFPNRSITVRTLDIGGDKTLGGAGSISELNPELGLRGIRYSLANKDIFSQQIRAILRAGLGVPELRIMFPMISSVDEFREARTMVHQCIRQLRMDWVPCHDAPVIGMMAELPSVIGTIRDFAEESDFFSIGTNDLVQFLLAADRSNSEVREYYRPGHPAVVRALKEITCTALAAGKDVSVCGEMVNNPAFVAFLIGIGIRQFSLDPFMLPVMQSLLAGLTVTDAEQYANSLLGMRSVREIEAAMVAFVTQSGLVVPHPDASA